MFRLFGDPLSRHFIDGGRVCCPQRGRDVDYDLCAGCPRMREIAFDPQGAYVRCASDAPPLWWLRSMS